jgi:hypothetical protein
LLTLSLWAINKTILTRVNKVKLRNVFVRGEYNHTHELEIDAIRNAQLSGYSKAYNTTYMLIMMKIRASMLRQNIYVVKLFVANARTDVDFICWSRNAIDVCVCHSLVANGDQASFICPKTHYIFLYFLGKQ